MDYINEQITELLFLEYSIHIYDMPATHYYHVADQREVLRIRWQVPIPWKTIVLV